MNQCMVQANLFGKNILNKMIKFLDIYNQDKKYHNLILRDLKNLFKKGDFILHPENLPLILGHFP